MLIILKCYNNISVKKTILVLALISAFIASVAIPLASYAQPYGKGTYNADVPYGSETSLSIATDGNINIPVTPTTDGVLATGVSTVTVTSTDVKGFKLYIRALSDTNMNNLGDTLPTSANVTPAPLIIDTWGYNTDASTNFVGINLNDVLIRSITVPASAGDITAVTYGMKLDMAKPAGNYVANVVYTAVPQTN
jgi:hypothetical protein